MTKCLTCGTDLEEDHVNTKNGSSIPIYFCPECESVMDQESLNGFVTDYGHVFGDQEVKEKDRLEPVCPYCNRNFFTGQRVVDLDESSVRSVNKSAIKEVFNSFILLANHEHVEVTKENLFQFFERTLNVAAEFCDLEQVKKKNMRDFVKKEVEE